MKVNSTWPSRTLSPGFRGVGGPAPRAGTGAVRHDVLTEPVANVGSRRPQSQNLAADEGAKLSFVPRQLIEGRPQLGAALRDRDAKEHPPDDLADPRVQIAVAAARFSHVHRVELDLD